MNGEVLLQLSVFYLTVMCGALLGMYYISLSWRIVVYATLGAVHIFMGLLFNGLSFIDRNNNFTVQTESLFVSIAEQLSKGMIQEEYLQPPNLAWCAIVSVLSVLAVVGGVVVVSLKMRWWSWILVCLALGMSAKISYYETKRVDGLAIAEQNELRRRIYDFVNQRRVEGIEDNRLAETIAIQLKGFRGTYENRKDATESAERILSALRELKPEPNKPE